MFVGHKEIGFFPKLEMDDKTPVPFLKLIPVRNVVFTKYSPNQLVNFVFFGVWAL